MKSRSVSGLRDILAGFDTNFLLPSRDFGVDSGGEAHSQDTLPLAALPDVPAAVAEDDSTNGGESSLAAASFALFDVSTDREHQSTDAIETSFEVSSDRKSVV